MLNALKQCGMSGDIRKPSPQSFGTHVHHALDICLEKQTPAMRYKVEPSWLRETHGKNSISLLNVSCIKVRFSLRSVRIHTYFQSFNKAIHGKTMGVIHYLFHTQVKQGCIRVSCRRIIEVHIL